MPSERRLRMAACALVMLLVGCAALSPQVFAPDVDPRPVGTEARVEPAAEVSAPPASGASHTVALARATNNARQLQERYVYAARSLSDGNAGIAASLLTLGTGGGIKAVTSPISRDISGLAVALGGLFTYGNTMVSLPRAKAYVAGALALECAIEAASATGEASLNDEIKEARSQQTELVKVVQDLQVLKRPETSTRTSGGATSGCSALPLGCGSPATSAGSDRERHARLCKAAEENRARHCTPVTKSEFSKLAHEDVGPTLDWAVDVRKALSDALTSAARAKPQIELSGNTLRGRTRAIESAVFVEVAKTEPDLNAIKGAAGAMVDAGGAFIPKTKAPAAPSDPAPAGTARSSSTGSERKDRPVELDELRSKVAMASDAANRLSDALTELDERARRAKSLDACSVPGGQRPVTFFVDTPRAEEAPVPLDDNLSRRLAPVLGKDAAATNVNRLVTDALRDCRERGLITESGSNGSLQPSTIVAITLGRCSKS